MGIHEDSLDCIYDTVSDCAKISKWAGGIGFHISSISSKGSKIKGTGGESSGIGTMLKVFNETKSLCKWGGKHVGIFCSLS